MDLRAESLKGLLAQIDPDEARNGKLRFPYACGLLARGALNDKVAYGRSLGLDIQVHPGGGWLIQRGTQAPSPPGCRSESQEHEGDRQ